MKLSKLWLQEWVNFSLADVELSDQLTMAGLEVDALCPVADQFTGVVVAQVLSTKPHPQADKLTLCTVDYGQEPLAIVCGAPNVRSGLKVALALIGAQLPGGMSIKETYLRTQLSQGMLCSAAELGLEDLGEGILELDEEAPIGQDLRTYFSLDDCVIDIDLTPNRADCLSVLGVAREVAVLNNLPLKSPSIVPIVPSIEDTQAVYLKYPKACPRYCGRIIRAINKEAKAPLWLRERLRRSGIKSIHPVVDVMNYVMLELGQPMHAFDLGQLKGAIHVRLATSHESLKLLDGQDIDLNEKTLVIADDKKVLALAGIFGGAESAVSADTEDVFLESAFFTPPALAGVARSYGLFTDASQRYERGVDPNLCLKALERATALILAIAGGRAGPVIDTCVAEHLPEKVAFTFAYDKVKKLTGLEIPYTKLKTLLEGLGIIIGEEKEGLVGVQIPSHRFDISEDVDLVEEVIRLYGYDKLRAEPLPPLTKIPQENLEIREEIRIASWFKARGYHETISYSFVDPQLQEILYPQAQAMTLLNPISSELSQMRVGLWPGLIASMIYNLHRQQQTVKIFEMGVTFAHTLQEQIECSSIAGLITGKSGHLSWNEEARFLDFYDLKGDVESLCSFLQVSSLSFMPALHNGLHSGQTAQIIIDNKKSGWIGVLHPRIADALNIDNEVILFELALEPLYAAKIRRYQPVSKYPRIRRDLSFLIDEGVSALQIETTIREAADKAYLKSLDIFDVYNGAGVPQGKKSVAIALSLQDSSKTLVDSQINLLISAIIKALHNEYSILLREQS